MNRISPPLMIECRNASVFYNGKPVLEDISLAIPEKTVVGIIGPSGTGKSTFLRTLCRMNDRIPGFRVQGQVRVNGNEIYAKGVDVYQLRRRVGMVFQTPCVFPVSIFENAVFGVKRLSPQLKKELPALAEQTLMEAGLWEEVKDRLGKPAAILSLGQQQRLAIARTLAIKPEILLMDEPTSSLDPKSAHAIEALIQSLKTRHTIAVVTHNLSQARRVSDQVVFIHRGRICESGTTEAVFSHPVKPETQAYLARQSTIG